MVTSERPFKCMEFEEFAHISETFSCVSRLVKVLTPLVTAYFNAGLLQMLMKCESINLCTTSILNLFAYFIVC